MKGINSSHFLQMRLLIRTSISGAAQDLLSGPVDAVKTLKAIFPRVSSPTSAATSNPQYLFWSERLLAKTASLSSETVVIENSQVEEPTVEFALRSFRAWASHHDVKQGDPASTTDESTPASPGSRSSIWRAYYDLLSRILQQNLPYTPTSEGPIRPQLASEFRRVETICENALLRNTKFPKADGSNQEIENWVEQVIQNWQIFCGPEWQEWDFGEGGHDALSRNVLDVSPFVRSAA